MKTSDFESAASIRQNKANGNIEQAQIRAFEHLKRQTQAYVFLSKSFSYMLSTL